MRKNILFIGIISLSFMTGCSLNNKEPAIEQTEVVSDIVEQSDVVILDKDGNAIQYGEQPELEIEDSTETEIKEEINTEETEESIEFSEGVEETESLNEESTTQLEETTESTETIVIEEEDLDFKVVMPDSDYTGYIVYEYIADDRADIPELILNSFKSVAMLGYDVTINSITVEGNLLNIDFSEGFKRDIISNTSGEKITVGCLVNSFILSYNGVEYVKITINGEGFETENYKYYDYLQKYE